MITRRYNFTGVHKRYMTENKPLFSFDWTSYSFKGLRFLLYFGQRL